MDLQKVSIASTIIYSQFPDRHLINILGPNTKCEYENLPFEVRSVSKYNLVEVEIPKNIFSYDEETHTLCHITFPKFQIKDCDGYLTFYTVELNYFKDWILKENMCPHSFQFCTKLKYLCYKEWLNYVYPMDYVYHFQCENPNTFHQFDRNKFPIILTKEYINNNNQVYQFELLDSSNKCFYNFRMCIQQDWKGKNYLFVG